MNKRSLKYSTLLAAFRVLPVKKIMAASPEKTQKLFRKACKGARIPALRDPELMILQKETGGILIIMDFLEIIFISNHLLRKFKKFLR